MKNFSPISTKRDVLNPSGLYKYFIEYFCKERCGHA